MKNREETKTFDLEICDVSHNEACVLFFPPYTISQRLIESFSLTLWE